MPTPVIKAASRKKAWGWDPGSHEMRMYNVHVHGCTILLSFDQCCGSVNISFGFGSMDP
jgi:hypothetical protein